MAKMKMFAPFDSKLKVWMNPMFFLHAGQAERAWIDIGSDGQSMVAKHPADFGLYQVGEFDDDTGLVSPIHPPVLLISGLAAKPKKDPQLPLSSK